MCPRCRKNRQRDWTFRLTYERDASDFVFWLALTFDDDHLQKVLENQKAAREPSRHFLEAIRLKFRETMQIKHYLVTEYGDGTDRFHHHCLLFCRCPGSDQAQKMKLQSELYEFIGCNNWDRSNNTAWPYGGVQSGPLHSGVFPYVTNYVNKPEIIDPNNPHIIRPFTRISQGIGLVYLDRIDKKRFEAGNYLVAFEGSRKVIPRYYREKLKPRNKQTMNAALLRGDIDLYHQVQDNRYDWRSREALIVGNKQHLRFELTRSAYEHDHSITYEEYKLHLAANEFRQYQEKLKRRKSL